MILILAKLPIPGIRADGENTKACVGCTQINLQREQKSTRWWKRIALAFAVAFLVSLGSVFLAWRKPPPEPVVYITRTGKKYHTYDCEFLERYNVKDKFAIVLDKAEEDYGPCGVCNPP